MAVNTCVAFATKNISYQCEDVGEAQQGDHNHLKIFSLRIFLVQLWNHQGAGRLVVQSLHLTGPGGLELGHHGGHHHHQEEVEWPPEVPWLSVWWQSVTTKAPN